MYPKHVSHFCWCACCTFGIDLPICSCPLYTCICICVSLPTLDVTWQFFHKTEWLFWASFWITVSAFVEQLSCLAQNRPSFHMPSRFEVWGQWTKDWGWCSYVKCFPLFLKAGGQAIALSQWREWIFVWCLDRFGYELPHPETNIAPVKWDGWKTIVSF